MSSCATLSRSGASDCFLRSGAGDVGVKFGPFSEKGCVVGQEQGMLCPYADRWPLPANLENAQIFVIADARIDQVDEGRQVIQIDFWRINVEERGKYGCSSFGRSFPAAGHDKDNAFLAAVGLTENHSVQGCPAPITQLRAHLGLCPDIFDLTECRPRFVSCRGLFGGGTVLSGTRLSSRCHELSGTAAHIAGRTHIANHRRKHDGNDEHWIPRPAGAT